MTALGARSVTYEPSLKWIDGTSAGDSSINPDFMIKRLDGHYDICEFKLPLLARKDLTKGERRRRRFIDPVNEGIAQLAHYAEYFESPGNAQYARGTYGITVENPRKILVVGNYENVDDTRLAEAQRQYGEFEILNYDAILRLYLAGKGISVPI